MPRKLDDVGQQRELLCIARKWPSRSEGNHHATREELMVTISKPGTYETDKSKLSECPDIAVAGEKRENKSCKTIINMRT